MAHILRVCRSVKPKENGRWMFMQSIGMLADISSNRRHHSFVPGSSVCQVLQSLHLPSCRGMKPPVVAAADFCAKNSVCNSTHLCAPGGIDGEDCIYTGEVLHAVHLLCALARTRRDGACRLSCTCRGCILHFLWSIVIPTNHVPMTNK